MKSIIPLISLGAIAATANAAVVLSWNMPPTDGVNLTPVSPGVAGTRVETGGNSTVLSTVAGLPSVAQKAFDATTAWTSRTDTNGGQTVLQSPTNFYGGAYITTSNSFVASAVLWRGSDTETFRVQAGGASGGAPTVAAAVLMDVTTTGLGFDSTSYLQSYQNLSSSASSSGRWLAYADGNLYVSETTYTMATTANVNSSTNAITLSNPDEINWAVWTPDTELDNLPGSFTTIGSTITNISKVGVYVAYSDPASSTKTWNLGGLQADLAVIPEPSALAGLFGLGVLALARRRA